MLLIYTSPKLSMSRNATILLAKSVVSTTTVPYIINKTTETVTTKNEEREREQLVWMRG